MFKCEKYEIITGTLSRTQLKFTKINLPSEVLDIFQIRKHDLAIYQFLQKNKLRSYFRSKRTIKTQIFGEKPKMFQIKTAMKLTESNPVVLLVNKL